ncbi:MAG: exo-alpha-sialidase, partial [Bacteroidetes bacterium]|nr:exo-alpha-sialidase [Bacteroidota bacterium]
SNPVSPDLSRNQLGVRQSFDWGKTWTSPVILNGGPAAYSDLVILPLGHIGVLYESNNYGAITFISFQYNQVPGE